ncbi:MAG TPA: amidohydrolase [Verrucomicrobiae bacterium]|nr:amidohydrolase [Verrucomicrobiae bacterium]
MTTRFSWLLATAVLLAATAGYAEETPAPSPTPGDADVIVINANVATQDPTAPQAAAFAVKDGKFVSVGEESRVKALQGPATKVIDAGGRTIIPGLNDSHIHAVRGGRFYNLELRWDGVKSLKRGLEMIREQAERTPKGQWVRVIGGWTPYQFQERRLPTVAELSEAAPNTPVFVLFLYSEAFVNKAGMEALKLTKESKAPGGGRYEFMEGGGVILHADPSPVILYSTIAQLPQLSAEEQVNSTQQFYRELNRFGLTSAVDPGGGGHLYPVDYQATKTLADGKTLPLRIANYLFAQKAGTELQDYQKWTAEEKLRLSGAADRLEDYCVEGGGENLVWSAGDFENFMAPRPELNGNMEGELTAVTKVLAEAKWPIRIHATYNESVSRMLDVFERVFRETSYKGRWAIDHAETISEKNLGRVKALGGGIAIQDRMAFAGELFVERYGKDAAAAAPPVRRMIKLGIPVGAGTDATRVSSHNPWLSLYWLVTGKTIGGLQLAVAENRLTREEALQLYTIGSAWFSGDELRKGRIAPGQLADFAILSRDYFSVPEEQIKNIESLLTVVNGTVVYATGTFAKLAPPPLPSVKPPWSPVAHFGGYVAQASK